MAAVKVLLMPHAPTSTLVMRSCLGWTADEAWLTDDLPVRLPRVARPASFDSVHSPESTQLDVFTKDVAPMLDKVYAGMSCTIFAYGNTGSG